MHKIKSFLFLCIVLFSTGPFWAQAMTPPTAQLMVESDSGVSSSDGITKINTPIFHGADATPQATVDLLLTQGGNTTTFTTQATDTGEWSIPISTPLPDGIYSVQAQQTVAGESSPLSDSSTLQIDTQNYTHVFTDQPWQSKRSVGSTISGTCESDYVKTYFNGVNGEVSVLPCINGTYTFTIPEISPDGSPKQYFAAYTLDTAGNMGAGVVKKFTTVRVTKITSPIKDRIYHQGAIIPIHISFSEPVVVIGTPSLELETGPQDGIAEYVSGSGSRVLIFNYFIQAGHTTTDLDYTSPFALDLNGGSIKNMSDIDVNTQLFSTDSSNRSLGAVKNIYIESNS